MVLPVSYASAAVSLNLESDRSPNNPREEFSASTYLPYILAHAYPELEGAFHRLGTFLNRGMVDSFGEAFAALPPHDRARIQERVGSELNQWFSLSREADSQVFFERVFTLGQRLEGRDGAAALGIFTGAAQILSEENLQPLSNLQDRFSTQVRILAGQAAIGDRLPHLLGHFTREATNWVTLGSFIAGGGANTLVRNSVGRFLASRTAGNFLTRGLGREMVAGTAAFLAEVPAFVGAGRFLGGLENGFRENPHQVSWSQDLAGAGLFLGTLKLTGLLAGQILRNVPRASWLHPAGNTAGALGGIYSGQRLEEKFGMRPGRDEGIRWVDTIHTLLHLRVAGGITQRLTSHTSLNPHRNRTRPPSRDLEIEFQPGEGLFSPLLQSFAWAGNSSGPQRAHPHRSSPETESHVFAVGLKTGSQDLVPLFENRMRSSRYPGLGRQIVDLVRTIPNDLPEFHERLLGALAGSPHKGTYRQYDTVSVMRELFFQDPLRTSTGHFEGARLQLFLEEAITDSNSLRGRRALQDIFENMENGSLPGNLDRLMRRYDYGESYQLNPGLGFSPSFAVTHSREIETYLREYRPLDQIMLLNFVHEISQGQARRGRGFIRLLGQVRASRVYASETIDSALDFARDHPQGKLVLRRLLNTFAAGDVEAKLNELQSLTLVMDAFSYMEHLARLGLDPEAMAESINGTRWTAYLSDMRLARKVVGVLSEIGPSVRGGHDKRLPRIRQLQAIAGELLRSGRALTPEDLIRGLSLDPHPRVQSIITAYREGRFEIQVLSNSEFDRRVSDWGEVAVCQLTFIEDRRSLGQPFRIYMREIPGMAEEGSLSPPQMFNEYAKRLMFLVHEGEHWRHFSGNYEGMESGSEVLRVQSREDRIVSETMAFLEEFSWSARNYHTFWWDYSQRLGLELPLYLRNVADQGYFGEANDQGAVSMTESSD